MIDTMLVVVAMIGAAANIVAKRVYNRTVARIVIQNDTSSSESSGSSNDSAVIVVTILTLVILMIAIADATVIVIA